MKKKSLIQVLSPESRKTVGELSGLFAVDSFAGGFVIQSIVSLWFFTRFGTDLSTISYILSIAGVLTAFSFLASAKIADRIGLINTMVFTHIPSNILLILVAFAPTLPMAIVFYLARMALSQMDVPTRQSYVVGVDCSGRDHKYFKKCSSIHISFDRRFHIAIPVFFISVIYHRRSIKDCL